VPTGRHSPYAGVSQDLSDLELLSKNSKKIRFPLVAVSASVWQLPAVCLVAAHPDRQAFSPADHSGDATEGRASRAKY